MNRQLDYEPVEIVMLRPLRRLRYVQPGGMTFEIVQIPFAPAGRTFTVPAFLAAALTAGPRPWARLGDAKQG